MIPVYISVFEVLVIIITDYLGVLDQIPLMEDRTRLLYERFSVYNTDSLTLDHRW